MSFEVRIARARLLADRYPSAADILAFYARLAEYQQAMVMRAPLMPDRQAQISLVPAFVDWVRREAPETLAAAASTLRDLSGEQWAVWFDLAFAPSPEPSEFSDAAALFAAEAIQQPWAEREAGDAARRAASLANADGVAACPACGRPPVVGVLREEGHGARRSLICVRCATEWAYPRVTCPGCGEREQEMLPVYNAEPFAHIRVEACDRCRRYIKTVDLSKDGHAVPIVDDLASVALDLWARREGYVRLRPSLLRV